MPWPAMIERVVERGHERGAGVGRRLERGRERAGEVGAGEHDLARRGTSVRVILVNGVSAGMTIVAGIPSRWAWYATPCAWLPADAATTPVARSAAGERAARKLRAPRSLNDAVNCRFSNFSQTRAPVISESVRDGRGRRGDDGSARSPRPPPRTSARVTGSVIPRIFLAQAGERLPALG